MVLAKINHDQEYLFLSNPHLNQPFSFNEAIDFGKKHGLSLRGFYCDDKEYILKNKKFPIIVTTQSSADNCRHAIIVERIKKKTVKIVDPAIGKMTISIQTFLSQFDGYGLLIDKYKRTKCSIKSKPTIEKRDILFIILFQFISGSACLTGTYFVSSQFPFYLPVIFFTLFFIFEILLRRYLVYVMEKMDEKFLYSNKGIKDYEEYYIKFTAMKSANILTFTNSLFALIIFTFLVIILAINNLLNLIFVAVVVITVLISKLLLNSKFESLNCEILKLEQKLNKIRSHDDFVSLTMLMNQKGYRYGLLNKLERYVIMGIYLFTVILVMAISSNTINVTYIVFNFAIMIMMKEYLEQMLSLSSSYNKYLSLKNYIVQFFK